MLSHVVELGSVAGPADGVLPTLDDLAVIDADPVRCFDPRPSAAMIAEVEAAQKDGDTLGGVVEVVVWGLPPGLGSHVHWDRRLDARLAGALMGIQAIKGVEVGDGFNLARTRGSAAHDEIVPGADGIARAIAPRRRHRGRDDHRRGAAGPGGDEADRDRARGPCAPSTSATGEAAVAHHQRSDVCAVPAAGVVAEAMVALVLADAALEKFGGDSVGETRRNHEAYLATWPSGSAGRRDAPLIAPIVLVGAPGSGKSTVGARLADRLGSWRSSTSTR